MFCKSCGSKLKENAKFCNNCGANVNDEVTTATYVESDKKNGVIFWILFALFLVAIGACFLPYFSILSVKSNFVYFDPGVGDISIKDGVFVIGFSVLSIILLLCKKRIPVFIFQVLSLAVIFINYFNDADKKLNYECGFFILIIVLSVTVILSLLRMILKKQLK